MVTTTPTIKFIVAPPNTSAGRERNGFVRAQALAEVRRAIMAFEYSREGA